MTPTDRDALEHRLLELLYDELSPEAASEVRAQLAEQPEAAERFDQWRQVRAQLDTLPLPEPDPQRHYDILRAARLAASPEAKRPWWAIFEQFQWAPAMAGLGLMVAAAGLYGVFNTMDTEQADLAPAAQPAGPEVAGPAPADLKAATAASSAGLLEGGVGGGGAAQAKAAAQRAPEPEVAAAVAAQAPPEPPAQAEAPPAEARPARRVRSKRDAYGSKGGKGGLARDLFNDEAPAADKGPSPEAKRSKSKPKAKAEAEREAKPIAQAATQADRKDAPRPGNAAPPALAEGADLDLLGGVAAEPTGGSAAPRAPARAPAPSADDGAKTVDRLTTLGFAPPPPASAASAVPAPDPAEAEEATVGDNARTGGAGPTLDDAVAGEDADRAREETASRTPVDAPAAANAPPRQAAKPAPAPAKKRATKQAASASRDVEADAEADPLARARAARQAGRLREAATAYEDVIDQTPGGANLQRVLFEAAQTYEALGDRARALQLYRLVVRGGGPNAAAAEARVSALGGGGGGGVGGVARPAAAPMDELEDADNKRAAPAQKK